MGRDRRNEERGDHYTILTRSILETEAWRALSLSAQALYPWVRLEWRGAKFNNNGKIRLSVRQAAAKMGCGVNTAARAFRELQAKGFLVVTEGARLGLTGEAKSPAFELTEIGSPTGNKPSGRKLYLEWRPGHDFPVSKATANNPTGRNRKTRPHHQNGDRNVIKMKTVGERTSSK